MNAAIELHAFMWLADLFRERGWSNPREFPLEGGITALQLLERLHIDRERVEVVFVNRKAEPVDSAVIAPGDRVALVPPGVPGPHRFLLGFKNK